MATNASLPRLQQVAQWVAGCSSRMSQVSPACVPQSAPHHYVGVARLLLGSKLDTSLAMSSVGFFYLHSHPSVLCYPILIQSSMTLFTCLMERGEWWIDTVTISQGECFLGEGTDLFVVSGISSCDISGCASW